MNWSKNPWKNNGDLFPGYIDDSVERWFERGGQDEELIERSFQYDPTSKIELSTKEEKYGFAMTFQKSTEGLFYSFTAIFVEFKKKEKNNIIYEARGSTLIIQSYYGNTLELDPAFFDTNPFRALVMAGTESAKYNKKPVTVYDILKKVTDDPTNKDLLSAIVIGNYARIDFTTDDVFNTEQDKKDKKPKVMTANYFMQNRATTFKNNFLSGLTINVTDMAADDPRNTYKDQLLGKDPNPLAPGGNLEGISVLFFPKAQSVRKF